MKKRRVLFPIPVDINNMNYHSGSFFSIYKELEKRYDLIPLGPLKLRKPIVATILNKLSKMGLFPYKFATMHNWKTINCYADELAKKSINLEYDFVFSVSTLYTAGFKSSKPKFAFTDFSFFNALNYYGFAINLQSSSKKTALEVDKYSFLNHDKVFLASNWAKINTEDAYDLPQGKISAVGRGANFESGYSIDAIKNAISKRQREKEKAFLFVGVNWARKGGDVAYEIVKTLHLQGYNVVLHVVGCSPPENILKCDFLKVYPYLDRSNDNDLSILRGLFANAWAFILPTRAEAMGIVFAEASSFGLPSIAFDTGGVSTAVENNRTGILQPLNESNDQFIPRIENLLNDNELYYSYSLNAFQKYQNELNWPVIINKIFNEIEKYLHV